MILREYKILIKYLKKLLFSSIYGSIKGTINIREKNKEINIIEVKYKNKQIYNIYKIKKCKIISSSVSDTAYIYKNLIINEPSYQYRFGKNDKIFNANINSNIALNYGYQNFKKKINGTLISLLSGGAAKTNYWHWMFDSLPKLGILEKSKIGLNNKYLLVPSLRHSFQSESLIALGINEKKLVDGQKNKHLEAQIVISTDHPVNLNNDPTFSITNIPIWIIKWLKKKYLINNKKNSFEKIFIDRLTTSRKIINLEEVKSEFQKYNFKFIKPENYSFTKQVKLFNSAKIVAGIHGAGFANIIFCKKKSAIIELQSAETGNAIKNLARKCDLNYYSIIEKNISKKLKYQNFSINVDIIKLNKILKKIAG